jgi:hypothetical protein
MERRPQSHNLASATSYNRCIYNPIFPVKSHISQVKAAEDFKPGGIDVYFTASTIYQPSSAAATPTSDNTATPSDEYAKDKED